MSKPAAETELSAANVRDLLTVQHPQFAQLPIAPGPSGWDNTIFRLGDDMAVRLPRREAAARLLEHEQCWLPQLAPQLPLPIPTPVCIGLPSESFRWHWSITPWFEGETLNKSPPAADQVEVLTLFLQALHTPAPADAPFNPWRSVPLPQRQIRFDQCARGLDATLRRIWDQAVNTPIDVTPSWIHGDLHARNVLVQDGRISAVIDWGDLAQGDRAADLAAIWMLFPRADDRERLMTRYRPASTQTWTRARGWALLHALIVLQSGDPEHQDTGQATLDRLREGP